MGINKLVLDQQVQYLECQSKDKRGHQTSRQIAHEFSLSLAHLPTHMISDVHGFDKIKDKGIGSYWPLRIEPEESPFNASSRRPRSLKVSYVSMSVGLKVCSRLPPLVQGRKSVGTRIGLPTFFNNHCSYSLSAKLFFACFL